MKGEKKGDNLNGTAVPGRDCSTAELSPGRRWERGRVKGSRRVEREEGGGGPSAVFMPPQPAERKGENKAYGFIPEDVSWGFWGKKTAGGRG